MLKNTSLHVVLLACQSNSIEQLSLNHWLTQSLNLLQNTIRNCLYHGWIMMCQQQLKQRQKHIKQQRYCQCMEARQCGVIMEAAIVARASEHMTKNMRHDCCSRLGCRCSCAVSTMTAWALRTRCSLKLASMCCLRFCSCRTLPCSISSSIRRFEITCRHVRGSVKPRANQYN